MGSHGAPKGRVDRIGDTVAIGASTGCPLKQPTRGFDQRIAGSVDALASRSPGSFTSRCIVRVCTSLGRSCAIQPASVVTLRSSLLARHVRSAVQRILRPRAPAIRQRSSGLDSCTSPGARPAELPPAVPDSEKWRAREDSNP